MADKNFTTNKQNLMQYLQVPDILPKLHLSLSTPKKKAQQKKQKSSSGSDTPDFSRQNKDEMIDRCFIEQQSNSIEPNQNFSAYVQSATTEKKAHVLQE